MGLESKFFLITLVVTLQLLMIPARTALVHGQGAGRGGARRHASGAVYFFKSSLKMAIFNFLYVRPILYTPKIKNVGVTSLPCTNGISYILNPPTTSRKKQRFRVKSPPSSARYAINVLPAKISTFGTALDR